MHIRSLEDTPSLSLVLDMQRAMSQAQNEGELVYGFSQRFHEIAGVSEILDLAVVPGDQRAFRIMDRMDLAKGCDSPLSIRANCRWDEPPDSVPVTRGGLIGKLIESGQPKIGLSLDPSQDPALADWVDGPRDALAVPVYLQGEINEWLILLREPGLSLDAMQLRVIISVLNMLSRSVYQLKLTRQVSELRDRLEVKLDEIAGAQQAILPDQLPQHPALDVAVHYRPSDYAGGDYYDFRTFSDGSLGFVIADVAGHGPGAAVVMAMLRTAMMIFRGMDLPTVDVVEKVNRLFVESLGRGTFVTVFFLRIYPETGRVMYVNAGHSPALLLRGDGSVSRLDSAGGPPLGIIPDVAVVGGEAQLAEGEAAVLYTDGLTECRSLSHEQFGEHRLLAALGAAERSAQGLVDKVREAVDDHSRDCPNSDDQCLVVVRLKD
ncbi:MAG: PP2C family protein-serine/threonine phosphatase [Pseudomonadota bacterium]